MKTHAAMITRTGRHLAQRSLHPSTRPLTGIRAGFALMAMWLVATLIMFVLFVLAGSLMALIQIW